MVYSWYNRAQDAYRVFTTDPITNYSNALKIGRKYGIKAWKGGLYGEKSLPASMKRPLPAPYYNQFPVRTKQRLVSKGKIYSNVPKTAGSRRKLPYKRYPKSKKARLRKRCDLYKKPPRKFVKRVEAVLSRDIPCGM